MKILITGVHGFIGFSTAHRLLSEGHTVVGVDKKRDARADKGPRIEELKKFPNYKVLEADLSDYEAVARIFKKYDFEYVLHFAGQYSVAYNTKNLLSFCDGNIRSWLHVMDCAKEKGIKRVIYASSTWVTGILPHSMYGATLEFRERSAGVYSAMGIETIGLRFGSTYGPHMRPDVGMHISARKLFAGQEIDLAGQDYQVSFLYIDDGVEVICRALKADLPQKHNVFTLVANDRPWSIGALVTLMEKHTGIKAQRLNDCGNNLPIGAPPLDVIQPLQDVLGYLPDTKMEDGIKKFLDWYHK